MAGGRSSSLSQLLGGGLHPSESHVRLFPCIFRPRSKRPGFPEVVSGECVSVSLVQPEHSFSLPKKGLLDTNLCFIYLFYLYCMVQNILDETSALEAEQRGTTRGAPTARVGIQDERGQIATNLARGQLSQAQAVSRPEVRPPGGVHHPPEEARGTQDSPQMHQLWHPWFFICILAQTLHLKHSAANVASYLKTTLKISPPEFKKETKLDHLNLLNFN